MKYDGGVYLDTKISQKGMEEGFKRIKNDMGAVAATARKMGNDISVSFSKIEVTKPVANASAQVKRLEGQLAAVTSEYKLAVADLDDKAAERLAIKRISLYDKLEAAREKLALEVAEQSRKQAAAEEKSAERERRAAEKAANAQEKASRKRLNSLTKPVQRFGSRLGGILSGALVFNLISAGLQNVTQYFGAALQSNDEFSQSLAKLKGALLTAFQPIYEVVVPALITLMNILSRVVVRIANFFSALTGKTVKESAQAAENLYEEANAIGATGSAAEKASKSLASFDEINTLQGKEATSGSAGGGVGGGFVSSGGEKPDFSWMDETTDKFRDIENLVIAIGVGLLAWKLSGNLLVGLATALATIAAINIAADWDNIKGWFTGVGDMIAGIFTLDAERIKEGFDKAWASFLQSDFLTKNLATLIMGWFGFDYENQVRKPLLDYIGEGGSMWTLFANAFEKFWHGVWGGTGEWFNEKVFKPIKKGFDDMNQVTSIVWTSIGQIIRGEWSEVAKTWAPVATWFDENVFTPTIKRFAELFGFAPSEAEKAAEGIKKAFALMGEFLQEVFGEAWGAVVAIFNGDDVDFSLSDGILKSFTQIVNKLISGINAVISKPFSGINSALKKIKSINILGAQPFAYLPTIIVPQIPYLAQGAVIPPNAPFMAVLGDQRNGTNIEAPLSTIQEAVALVMNDQISAMMAGFEALLEENRALRQTVESIEVGDSVIGQAAARYNRKMAVVKGGV